MNEWSICSSPGPGETTARCQAVAAVNDVASILCPPGAPGRDLPGILKRQEERDAVWNYGSNGKSHETRQSALAATSTWSRWCHEADAQASVPAGPGSGWTSRLGHRLCSNFGAQCQVSDFRGPVLYSAWGPVRMSGRLSISTVQRTSVG